MADDFHSIMMESTYSRQQTKRVFFLTLDPNQGVRKEKLTIGFQF